MPTTFDYRPESGRTALRLKKPDKHPLILAYIWRDADGVYRAKDIQLRLKRPPVPSRYFFEFLNAVCKAYAAQKRIRNYQITQC